MCIVVVKWEKGLMNFLWYVNRYMEVCSVGCRFELGVGCGWVEDR